MRTVWKYYLRITDEQQIEVPLGGTVALVGVQGESLCLWVDVDPEAEKTWRVIAIKGTGHYVPADAVHLGSAIMPPFVWHVYELPSGFSSVR